MQRPTMTVWVLACLVSIGVSAVALAENQAQDQLRGQPQTYGSHLMTEQERAEHRARMRAATTAEERERIRKEHHERMELRAKERGVKIPDEPPPQGGGKGPGGMAPGGGMGPGGGGMGPGGGGMGPGGGRGR